MICFWVSVKKHSPYPQTRSNARDAFTFYQDVIEGFAPNRFRTTDELAFYSHALPLWVYSQKRLVPCDESYYYVQTRRRDRIAYYKAILHSKEDHAASLFFCINDVGNHSAEARWQSDLLTLLTTYYPNPSSFERAHSASAEHL